MLIIWTDGQTFELLPALLTYQLTFGDVALANNGNKPPQAIIKLSANWEIKWTVFTTNIAFSLEFTKSSTLLVEWLRQTWKEKCVRDVYEKKVPLSRSKRSYCGKKKCFGTENIIEIFLGVNLLECQFPMKIGHRIRAFDGYRTTWIRVYEMVDELDRGWTLLSSIRILDVAFGL